MTCCSSSCAAAAQFDPQVAERDLRRYQRHGPDLSTRILLSELRRWPFEGLQLLDVGASIGVIAGELAGAGLAGVADASPAYLEAARRHLASRAASRPAQFLLGDFAATAASLPNADIVTLDRVVCCYPDVEALLREAAVRARRMVAFTYHPDRWYLHAAVALENSWYRLKQNHFRAFVHSPERMASVLESAGFVRAARQATLQWALDVYRRADASVAHLSNGEDSSDYSSPATSRSRRYRGASTRRRNLSSNPTRKTPPEREQQTDGMSPRIQCGSSGAHPQCLLPEARSAAV